MKFQALRKIFFCLFPSVIKAVVIKFKKIFLDFTDALDAVNKTAVEVSQEDIFPGETVYKEEISGNQHIRYLYKATLPKTNVTLASAINAGTFEDKGKMGTIAECIKSCGVSPDCNVAFMLSSQCFNVHCFSDDTCRTKPAYSALYKPELAYIKHRIIRKPRNISNKFYFHLFKI